jgi:hypothetical protein
MWSSMCRLQVLQVGLVLLAAGAAAMRLEEEAEEAAALFDELVGSQPAAFRVKRDGDRGVT